MDRKLYWLADIKRERWAEFCVEALWLMATHNDELGNGLPLDCDHERIIIEEEYGNMFFVTARIKRIVVGYITWFLDKEVEHKGVIIGRHGPWYVRPDMRLSPIGDMLWRYSKGELLKAGVTRIRSTFPRENKGLMNKLLKDGAHERYVVMEMELT